MYWYELYTEILGDRGSGEATRLQRNVLAFLLSLGPQSASSKS